MPLSENQRRFCERLSLLLPDETLRPVLRRLVPYVTPTLPPSLALTVQRLFEVSELHPDEVTLAAEALLAVFTETSARDPAADGLAALLTGNVERLQTFRDSDPAATAQRWFTLEAFLLTSGITQNAEDGWFAAGWARHLTQIPSDETIPQEFARAAGVLFYRQSALKRLSARLRHNLRGKRFAASPAESPLFTGKAVLLPEKELLTTPERGEPWLFLTPWAEALKTHFAPNVPILPCRTAQTAPKGQLTVRVSLLGKTVRLPDVLTSEAIAAFRSAFDTVNRNVAENTAERRFYAVVDTDETVGSFVPTDCIPLAAPLWADFFAALEIITGGDADTPASARGVVPHAVKRSLWNRNGNDRATGFLFVFSEDDVPSRRHTQCLRTEEAFLAEETERSGRRLTLTDRRHFPKSLAADAFTPEALDVLSGVFSADELALLGSMSRFQVAQAVVDGFRTREKRT